MKLDPIPEANQQDGENATNAVWERGRKALERAGMTIEYRAQRLFLLSKFRARKPFHHHGSITYTKLIHFPEVQLDAIKEANLMDGAYAPQQKQLSGLNGGPIKIIFHDMSAGPPTADPRDDQTPAEKDSKDSKDSIDG